MSCGKPCNCASYREHLASIAMQPTVHPVELKERQWDKDMAAYKSLRKQGFQPRGIDGCAEIEGRASTQFELETMHLFRKEDLPHVAEGIRIAREIEETGSSDGIHREVAP